MVVVVEVGCFICNWYRTNGTYTIKVNGGQSAAPINPDAYNPTNSGNGYGSEFGKTDDILIVKGVDMVVMLVVA